MSSSDNSFLAFKNVSYSTNEGGIYFRGVKNVNKFNILCALCKFMNPIQMWQTSSSGHLVLTRLVWNFLTFTWFSVRTINLISLEFAIWINILSINKTFLLNLGQMMELLVVLCVIFRVLIRNVLVRNWKFRNIDDVVSYTCDPNAISQIMLQDSPLNCTELRQICRVPSATNNDKMRGFPLRFKILLYLLSYYLFLQPTFRYNVLRQTLGQIVWKTVLVCSEGPSVFARTGHRCVKWMLTKFAPGKQIIIQCAAPYSRGGM